MKLRENKIQSKQETIRRLYFRMKSPLNHQWVQMHWGTYTLIAVCTHCCIHTFLECSSWGSCYDRRLFYFCLVLEKRQFLGLMSKPCIWSLCLKPVFEALYLKPCIGTHIPTRFTFSQCFVALRCCLPACVLNAAQRFQVPECQSFSIRFDCWIHSFLCQI